ncbi:hypothetical protein M3Y94_01245600 [Aphelenchoides besseyi]|nr:hypothetical protein M3Y94_01245600 [Aphelenchoides besseyi]KAI6219368.1 hypothetical protein M3Y95_01103700 [Aphelenchoides besseyi]
MAHTAALNPIDPQMNSRESFELAMSLQIEEYRDEANSMKNEIRVLRRLGKRNRKTIHDVARWNKNFIAEVTRMIKSKKLDTNCLQNQIAILRVIVNDEEPDNHIQDGLNENTQQDQKESRSQNVTDGKPIQPSVNQPEAQQNKQLGAVYSSSNTSHFLKLYNGDSNCFLISALNVIHGMLDLVNGLKVERQNDQIQELIRVLDHHTQYVEKCRNLLPSNLQTGYQDASEVLELMLNDWIPSNLKSLFEAKVRKRKQCCFGNVSKTSTYTVLHKKVQADNFLSNILEQSMELTCDSCGRKQTPKLRLINNNPEFKYLVVIIHNPQRLRVFIRNDDSMVSMGRKMRVIGAVDYDATISHYKSWRRDPNISQSWFLIDSLKWPDDPIQYKTLEQPLTTTTIFLLEVLPMDMSSQQPGVGHPNVIVLE